MHLIWVLLIDYNFFQFPIILCLKGQCQEIFTLSPILISCEYTCLDENPVPDPDPDLLWVFLPWWRPCPRPWSLVSILALMKTLSPTLICYELPVLALMKTLSPTLISCEVKVLTLMKTLSPTLISCEYTCLDEDPVPDPDLLWVFLPWWRPWPWPWSLWGTYLDEDPVPNPDLLWGTGVSFLKKKWILNPNLQ